MSRLFEPSSWAGLAAILATIVNFVPGPAGLIIGGIGAGAGAIAVYLREHKHA